jgi:hypothetical protein
MGSCVRGDRLTRFFHNLFNQASVVNTEPIKLKPTWSNNRSGIDCVSKRLDMFLIHRDDFLQKVERYRSWVGSNRCSYHLLVVLELDKIDTKPRAPFKFNPGWASDEEF